MAGDTLDGTAVRERRCEQCGSHIDARCWHPVAAPPEERYRVYHFCSESCRDRWRARRE